MRRFMTPGWCFDSWIILLEEGILLEEIRIFISRIKSVFVSLGDVLESNRGKLQIANFKST